MQTELQPKKTGTTTVGLITKDAVILAAETKATMGYLVATRQAKKILQLEDHIAMTIAGLEGDGQALARYVRAELKLYRLREERRASVEAAANLIANILYARRFYPYFVQLLVGGYDDQPRLYSFDPTGSLQEEKKYFSTGSGSPIALGVLEDRYKPKMTLEDGKKLAVQAIKAAIRRDIASGAAINLAVIDEKGFKEIPSEEVKRLLK
jgi:proteasome beta subunit